MLRWTKFLVLRYFSAGECRSLNLPIILKLEGGGGGGPTQFCGFPILGGPLKPPVRGW